MNLPFAALASFASFASFAVLSFCLAGCAASTPAPSPAGAGAVAAPTPVPGANLEVRVSEVVERADLDALSYAKVYVDGELKGQTNIAPRSQDKSWQGVVPPGNHPVRAEMWDLPGTGDWQKPPDDAQPRERFVRVEAGGRAILAIRRHPGGRYDFDVTRQ